MFTGSRTVTHDPVENTRCGAQVGEKERQRDAGLEEITALKEASEAEVASAAERKKHLQAVESEARRISEETQRLEVELRKLRARYQVKGRGRGGLSYPRGVSNT